MCQRGEQRRGGFRRVREGRVGSGDLRWSMKINHECGINKVSK